MSRWAAILAGGSGTRFWPLSTPVRPKQMLPLAGNAPLLRQAVDRLADLFPADHVLVLTGRHLLERTRQLLPDLPSSNILAEPRPASTGPALTWATVIAARRDPEASILSLHADWYVGDDEAFRVTARRALDVAERHDRMVTVGMAPTRPDVGYGYIVPGGALDQRARAVDRFAEKPDAPTAARLIESGALWNSGLFAWTAQRFLIETRDVAPEIGPHLPMLERDDVKAFFSHVTPVAIDVSHFERSKHVAVVSGRFPWDDVGTWASLLRVRHSDEQGNVLVGDAIQRDASRCVAWTEGDIVVLDGVEDLVVVCANGITLVTTTDRAAHLKALQASLPERMLHPAPD